jgi:hypothetical protein
MEDILKFEPQGEPANGLKRLLCLQILQEVAGMSSIAGYGKRVLKWPVRKEVSELSRSHHHCSLVSWLHILFL